MTTTTHTVETLAQLQERFEFSCGWANRNGFPPMTFDEWLAEERVGLEIECEIAFEADCAAYMDGVAAHFASGLAFCKG